MHQTTTDEFGMVNLLIGRGEPTSLGTGDFTLIDWNGRAKDLQVEINFEGSTQTFENMSRQELTFVPSYIISFTLIKTYFFQDSFFI